MKPYARYCGDKLKRACFQIVEAPLNFGTSINPLLGWFDPPRDSGRSLDGPNRPKLEGISESIEWVHRRIHDLIDDGSETKDIHLFGHSQGGAIALAAGLTFPLRLGSVCTIAGYLALTPEMAPLSTGTHYFLQHAEQDDNVSVRWAHYADTFIRRIGEPCEVKCWRIEQKSIVARISNWPKFSSHRAWLRLLEGTSLRCDCFLGPAPTRRTSWDTAIFTARCSSA